jgi:hypothetical protein
MFLPEVVADVAADFVIVGPDGKARPLVMVDRTLYRSDRTPPPETPGVTGWVFALLGLASVLAIALPARVAGDRLRWLQVAPARMWMVASGLAGLLLVFLWVATAHEAAWRNENLLLFHPLNLLLLGCRGGHFERAVAVIVGISLVVALGLKLLPGVQWNYDLLLWMVPAQAAMLFAWRKASRQMP